MTTGQELPLACSLSPAELEARKQLIRSIGASGVEAVEQEGGELSIRFRPGTGLRGSLEQLITLEAQCCPFLDFHIDERDDALTLSVGAPDGPATALDAIRHMLASPGL